MKLLIKDNKKEVLNISEKAAFIEKLWEILKDLNPTEKQEKKGYISRKELSKKLKQIKS